MTIIVILMSDKVEKVRVIVQVKRVWLAVRFNCKLSFIIKNELAEKVAEIDETHSLFRGECLVNQAVSFELSQELLVTRCKKLKLIVMMISANGMVPAGFVTFGTRPKPLYELNECILPLERCEDSRAQIKFMHMYELSGKTPLQKSYINELGSKGSMNPFDMLGALSKMQPKSSHSLNRESLSAHKARQRETIQPFKAGRGNFNQGLVSPRQLLRTPNGQAAENSVKLNDFPESLAKERQRQDSSVLPLSRQQLLKEHQEYWLQIVRMEEEMQVLKAELEKAREDNRQLIQEAQSRKEQADTMREYYEGHEQKIHAFLGQIQQNSETIRRLERELQQNATNISQKQEFERECQELLHLQESQLRQHLNTNADMQERLSRCEAEKRQLINRAEVASETILFLQGQLQAKEGKQAELVDKISSFEVNIGHLEQQKYSLNATLNLLRQQIKQYTNQLQTIPVLQYENISLKESLKKDQEKVHELSQSIVFFEQQHLSLSSRQRQAIEAEERQKAVVSELNDLRRAYDVLAQSSSVGQSRIGIMESELGFCQKERQNLKLECKAKDSKLADLQLAFEGLQEESKVSQLQLIQLEAAMSGKESTILAIRAELNLLAREKNSIQDKFLALQMQFEALTGQFSQKVEDNGKMATVISGLEQELIIFNKQKNDLEQHLKDQVISNEQLRSEVSELRLKLQAAEEQSNLKEQLEKQLSLLEQKYSSLEQEYGQAVQSLEQQKRSPRKSIHDQYQGSYSQSVTAVTLQLAKVEQMLAEAKEKLADQAASKQEYSRLLTEKEAELARLKSFTQEKLLQVIQATKDLKQQKQKCSDYQNAVWLLSQQCRDLQGTNKDHLLKIDQLASELQFVTEILQRERQQKSDVELSIEQKSELASISEEAQLRQDSAEEGRSSEEVILQIQSKLNSPSKESAKEDASKKRKRKR